MTPMGFFAITFLFYAVARILISIYFSNRLIDLLEDK